MENWSYKLNAAPKSPFRVLEELEETDDGRRLRVRTETGPQVFWCPRRLTSLYRYEENSQRVVEVWIPDWLAEKAGLFRKKSA